MKNLLSNLSKNTSQTLGKAKFQFEKNKPAIYLGLGIAGLIGTIILASKETLEATKILDEHEKMLDDIHKVEKLDPEYKLAVSGKDKTLALAKTSGKMVVNYLPAMALGSVSLAFILESYNIADKRYTNALKACGALSEVFEKYRSRVREELGDEMDRHFRYGTRKEILEKEVVDEKGKKKKIKEEVEVTDSKDILPSDYSRVFDESNPNWDADPYFSMAFLKSQNAVANQILQSRGYLFLNEVYEMLGFAASPIGAIAGWVIGNGDGYVDFGLFDLEKNDVRKFINGKENYILLEFNVDGEIWNKL